MVAQPERIALDVDAQALIARCPTGRTADAPTHVGSLDAVYAINAAFLEMLRADAYAATASLLPTALARNFIRLPAAALHRIARCPFALFDLNGALSNVEENIDDAPKAPDVTAIDFARMRFANAALFQAWHTVRAEPTRARLWFGLDCANAKRLRDLPADKVAMLAFTSAGTIMPRCLGHSLFWADLLRHAESGDTRRLKESTWLGRQLIGTAMATARCA